ncbi:unnamed protein product [Paramecium pentaurelia]|uniref:Uncharacterized protein n=1 Tax=Paramecium pentaurelia TaxID=43138 RepID=A0A8S1XGK9_9CILI|nr:unnamed protein product [Paramecium pentaurelia]
MQDQIKIVINRLNQERQLLKERQNTFNYECSPNIRTGFQMQKPITLDPPKLFMQTIQFPNVKAQRQRNVNNKLKINANFRRRSTSQKTEQNSNPMVGIVKKFDFSFFNYDPLPIVYNNQSKMLKMKRQSSNIIRI